MNDSDSQVRTRRQIMRDTVESAVHLVRAVPCGAHQFQSRIIEAEQERATNIAAAAYLISTAQAALVISNIGADSLFASWYQEKAQRLLERAIDVLAVAEADLE